VDVTGNEATIFPALEEMYPSDSYLSLHYEDETFLLKLALFILYSIPTLPITTDHPPITSKFKSIEDTWLPAKS